MAEGANNDREMLREANNDDVLDVISPELLDRIAHRLYAEDETHLSAYERLLQSDKRRKMEYLNNIRPDLIPGEPEHHEPVAEDHKAAFQRPDDHFSIDDIPKSDPTKESIRDRVMRESQRRQEEKRKKDEAAKALKQKADLEESLAHLTPEERLERTQQEKWRSEFEKEQ